MTLARIANPAPPKPKQSIYRHDYHIDLESTRSRQRINHAMDPADSMLISKPGSPILYDTQAEVAHGLDGGLRGSRTSVKYPVDRISTQQELRYQAGTRQIATTEMQSSQHVHSSRDWSDPLEDLQVATGQAMHLIRARQRRNEALEAELSKRSAQAEAWKAQYIAQKQQNDERSLGGQ